jgi:DNA-binding MarR family transcriptional regulator
MMNDKNIIKSIDYISPPDAIRARDEREAVVGPGATQLKLLSALEAGTDESQASLSRRVGAAVGLINALLRRAVRKGYVKMTSAPARRYTYYLTPKGFSEKSRLVAEYLNFSLSFFREARSEYFALFMQAQQDGVHRVALIGAGELAEIAALAAMEANIAVVSVVDTETNQRRIAGVDIVRDIAQSASFDAVVVTDARTPQATYDVLRSTLSSERVLCPSVLHVAPERWASAASTLKQQVG